MRELAPRERYHPAALSSEVSRYERPAHPALRPSRFAPATRVPAIVTGESCRTSTRRVGWRANRRESAPSQAPESNGRAERTDSWLTNAGAALDPAHRTGPITPRQTTAINSKPASAPDVNTAPSSSIGQTESSARERERTRAAEARLARKSRPQWRLAGTTALRNTFRPRAFLGSLPGSRSLGKVPPSRPPCYV